MKTRLSLLLLFIVVSLLIVSAAVAQSDRATATNTAAIQPATATGGTYHLESLRWQFKGASDGGPYQLTGPQSPTLRGNGCCCSYLPCLQRN